MSPITELMTRSMDGVFAIDDEQRVIFWNQACTNMTGIPAEKAIGAKCHEVLKGHDPHGRPICRPECPLGSLFKGGPPPAQLPMRINRTSGEAMQFCVSTMLVPVLDKGLWNVVHVLRRGRDSQRNVLLDTSGPPPGEGQACGASPTTGLGYAVSLLTTREREILHLLAHGADVGSMSQRLHISSATVRNHIQRLMAKLDVHSRVEAVAFAHRHQLI